ncbi:19159_t:CDS:1 [Dentiscutata erythropus]|uniref:19159_t:CDS:1 n=1 Tax=Dentiscutata erythropus TaxID=1348616 RepID=A0A9N8YN55_9GLOM|nr:19159_t:CDS:1 [Dentiscutata erythropus]
MKLNKTKMANKEKIDLFDIMDANYLLEKYILLTNIDFKDLHKEISKMLKLKCLSYSLDKEFKEVNRIIFGKHLRIFIFLSVMIKRETKNVHFLVNTSSPN